MQTRPNWGFRFFLISTTALLAVVVLGGCKHGNPLFDELVWNDEFNGNSINGNNWTYDIGTGSTQGLIGWGNNELQYYTQRSENVRIENFPQGGRGLVIEAHREVYQGSSYTSARLKTQGLQTFTYGRIEARIKLPVGTGLWPAFWMLGANIEDVGWPICGEIDIMEYRGNDPSTILGTIHFGNPYGYRGQDFSRNSFAQDFHIFSLEWTPGELRWYVDGILYAIQRNWNSSLQGVNAPFDRPFFLLINLAIGGNFLPNPPSNANYFPQKLLVDWIRVYQ